jgi:prevent-host-death family protein
MTTHDYPETMKKVRVAELKARLSSYLRSVRRGHEVTVYDRDQPIAKLVPYARQGALSVREPARSYGKLAEVPMPPPLRLDVDPVELLLEDRQSEG